MCVDDELNRFFSEETAEEEDEAGFHCSPEEKKLAQRNFGQVTL